MVKTGTCLHLCATVRSYEVRLHVNRKRFRLFQKTRWKMFFLVFFMFDYKDEQNFQWSKNISFCMPENFHFMQGVVSFLYFSFFFNATKAFWHKEKKFSLFVWVEGRPLCDLKFTQEIKKTARTKTNLQALERWVGGKYHAAPATLTMTHMSCFRLRPMDGQHTLPCGLITGGWRTTWSCSRQVTEIPSASLGQIPKREAEGNTSYQRPS